MDNFVRRLSSSAKPNVVREDDRARPLIKESEHDDIPFAIEAPGSRRILYFSDSESDCSQISSECTPQSSLETPVSSISEDLAASRTLNDATRVLSVSSTRVFPKTPSSSSSLTTTPFTASLRALPSIREETAITAAAMGVATAGTGAAAQSIESKGDGGESNGVSGQGGRHEHEPGRKIPGSGGEGGHGRKEREKSRSGSRLLSLLPVRRASSKGFALERPRPDRPLTRFLSVGRKASIVPSDGPLPLPCPSLPTSSGALAPSLGATWPKNADADRRALKRLAARLLVRSEEDEWEEARAKPAFDLLDDPGRVLLMEGTVAKRGTSSMMKRTTRRTLLLFPDVLLVADPFCGDGSSGKGGDKVVVRHVIDLRQVRSVWDCSYLEENAWEVEGETRRWRFVCEEREGGAREHARWMAMMKEALWRLALAKEGRRELEVGWMHRLVKGTVFATAMRGDVSLLKLLMAREKKRAREKWRRRRARQQRSRRREAEEKGGGRKGWREGEGEDMEGDGGEEEEEEAAAMAYCTQKDAVGWLPVHYAAAKGREKAVRYLLEMGGEDVDPVTEGGETPLHVAAMCGQEGVVRYLLMWGASIWARNHREEIPLALAVKGLDGWKGGRAGRGGKVERVVSLILAAAPSETMVGKQLSSLDGRGSMPLHAALEVAVEVEGWVQAREEEEVGEEEEEVLKAKEARRRREDAEGLVRLLVDRGADVRARRGVDGLSPLQIACGGGAGRGEKTGKWGGGRLSEALGPPAPRKILQMLLDKGAPPNGVWPVTPPPSLKPSLTTTPKTSTPPSLPAAALRPLEILLTPRFYESEDAAREGGKEGELDPLTEGVEDDAARRMLAARACLAAELIAHGARLSTQKMVKSGVDVAVVATMDAARIEWAQKTVGMPVALEGEGIAGKIEAEEEAEEGGGEGGGREGRRGRGPRKTSKGGMEATSARSAPRRSPSSSGDNLALPPKPAKAEKGVGRKPAGTGARAEKLSRMTNQTEGMQQRAMDFAAAAKALAEREKGRKWWEL
ncbi:hypothetical protein NSK_001814 [Nannochloropsis salina CCMP1776]|uniref:PH domain-containing protein n=1 Tax=Nannochloropsis salina CCMP1776 TaxID=1027361 RepID=A0A4D9D5S2_9STRA|nr:hypothetical protein NSK_001814 [Nannochloropsis salina CCMP1776]|eukprot:TFJ86726.1 hypothetical protein NSK_001814 [Nannochloropsis salina CCMP1776]